MRFSYDSTECMRSFPVVRAHLVLNGFIALLDFLLQPLDVLLQSSDVILQFDLLALQRDQIRFFLADILFQIFDLQTQTIVRSRSSVCSDLLCVEWWCFDFAGWCFPPCIA